MQHIAAAAFAKLNLGLEVLRKRPDGYHDINTVFARVRLSDTLLLHRNAHSDRGSISLDCTPDLQIPANENLVYLATERLQMALGVNYGAHIELFKTIPSGAGLGGGSSDAAAVLCQLPNLWEVEAAPSTLRKVAEGIGSDVPFFLEDDAAVGTGRGEKLERFNFQLPWWTLIIHPGIHVSTPWAYKALKVQGERQATDFRSVVLQSLSDPQALRTGLHNDFESVVFDAHPLVGQIKEDIYAQGALFASMSGSGSSVFGFFTNKKAAENAAQKFQQFFVHVCAPFNTPASVVSQH